LKKVPLALKKVPLALKKVPLALKKVPLALKKVPLALKNERLTFFEGFGARFSNEETKGFVNYVCFFYKFRNSF
jgi:hypothetical protein